MQLLNTTQAGTRYALSVFVVFLSCFFFYFYFLFFIFFKCSSVRRSAPREYTLWGQPCYVLLLNGHNEISLCALLSLDQVH